RPPQQEGTRGTRPGPSAGSIPNPGPQFVTAQAACLREIAPTLLRGLALRGGPRQLLAATDERVRELHDLEQVDDVERGPEGEQPDRCVHRDAARVPVSVAMGMDEARRERRECEGRAPPI